MEGERSSEVSIEMRGSHARDRGEHVRAVGEPSLKMEDERSLPWGEEE